MKRPDSRESFELKAMLNSIGNALVAALPPQAIDSYRELVAVGEAQVALENLCTNLDDLDAEVPPDLNSEIQQACERVGVASHYWEALRKR